MAAGSLTPTWQTDGARLGRERQGPDTGGGASNTVRTEKAQVLNARTPRSARTEKDDVQSGGLGSGRRFSTSGKQEKRFGRPNFWRA